MRLALECAADHHPYAFWHVEPTDPDRIASVVGLVSQGHVDPVPVLPRDLGVEDHGALTPAVRRVSSAMFTPAVG